MRNARARRQRAEDERREGEALGESRASAERDVAADEQRQSETAVARGDVGRWRRAWRAKTRRAPPSCRAREAAERADSTRPGAARSRQPTSSSSGSPPSASMADVARAHPDVSRPNGPSLARPRSECTSDGSRRRGRCRWWPTPKRPQRRTHAEELQREASRAREAEVEAHRAAAQAEAAFTTLDGKLTALEQLERERVGLAPAAARLLAATRPSSATARCSDR